MPLVLDANGNKFGKSEGNALWLDKNKTSSYALYQYLINSDDKMVEDYLKIFTFLTPEEIIDIMDKHNKEPHLRLAQKTLAYEIIKDLHGVDECESAKKISEALFSGNIRDLTSNQIEEGLSQVPTFEITEDTKLIDLLVDNKIVTSRREAREFLGNSAISINGEKVNDENLLVNKDIAIEGKYIVVRKGKKNYYLIKIQK